MYLLQYRIIAIQNDNDRYNFHQKVTVNSTVIITVTPKKNLEHANHQS